MHGTGDPMRYCVLWHAPTSYKLGFFLCNLYKNGNALFISVNTFSLEIASRIIRFFLVRFDRIQAKQMQHDT